MEEEEEHDVQEKDKADKPPSLKDDVLRKGLFLQSDQISYFLPSKCKGLACAKLRDIKWSL